LDFFEAYLVERYCITVHLVLISFGGTAFPLDYTTVSNLLSWTAFCFT